MGVAEDAMQRWTLGLAMALLIAGQAAAECTHGPDYEGERAKLLQALKDAPTEQAGREAENDMWLFWAEAPDDRAQMMIDAAFRHRQMRDLEGAQTILEELVRYCPAYAEGWNQLATIQFYRGRYDASLETIREVLSREPAHFGALMGRTVILIRQGRVRLAQNSLASAVAVHPWVRGRDILPEPPNEDL